MFFVFLRLCRCNEPPMGCPLLICSMGEFLYSFRCCSNPRGRCPALRLLLILRRLTDIQSELVLYWKVSAGSGGLWDKNWRGKEKIKEKFTVKSKLQHSFLYCLLSGRGGRKLSMNGHCLVAITCDATNFVFATFAPRPFL